MGLISDLIGGSKSKQELSQNIISSFTSTVSQLVQNNCISSTNANQIISIVGDNNIAARIQQQGAILISASCAVSQKDISQMVQEASAALTALYQQKSNLFSDAFNTLAGSNDSQKIQQTLQNMISTQVNSTLINNCVTSAYSNQMISVKGNNNLIIGVTQTEYINSISKCISSQLINTQIIQQIVGTTSGSYSLIDTTLQDLGNLVKNIGDALSNFVHSALWGWVPAVLAFVFLIFLVVAVVYWRSTVKSST